jgi:hypothetical protein
MLSEDQVIDIWTGLKEFFDKKAIETVATKYIDILADNGVTDDVFKAAMGGDEDLDDAIEYYLDDDGYDVEVEYNEDWED